MPIPKLRFEGGLRFEGELRFEGGLRFEGELRFEGGLSNYAFLSEDLKICISYQVLIIT